MVHYWPESCKKILTVVLSTSVVTCAVIRKEEGGDEREARESSVVQKLM